MRNKRGWMRLLESIIAVFILASVLIVVYNNKSESPSYAEKVGEMEVRVLEDIATNSELRNAVLQDIPDMVILNNSVSEKVSANFGFKLVVCRIDYPSDCSFENDFNKEVFVENRIISSNLTKYNPKLVRIYVWGK